MTEHYESGAVERELAEHGSFASITKGVSMQPLFRTRRDMIVISAVERPLKKYDVVLYRGNGGEYILHRIIKIGKDFYVIRGDNTYSKEYVPREKIIGILTSYNRKGKHGSPDSFSFKFYSRIWHYLYPVRYLFVRTRAPLARAYRKMFPKKKSAQGEKNTII